MYATIINNMYYFLTVFVVLFSTFNIVNGNSQSRYRRYVAFPEGSTVSVTFSLAFPTISFVPTIFGEGVSWSIIYELPNSNDTINISSRVINQRRQRRDLYHKMETLMNSLNVDGRGCVYRVLCEVEQKLKGRNIIEEIIKIIFRFPLDRIYDSEPETHRLYHRARRMGRMNYDCMQLFPTCHISIIDLALIQLYTN